MANDRDNLLAQLDADVLLREAALELALKTAYDAIWARLTGDLDALLAARSRQRAPRRRLIRPALAVPGAAPAWILVGQARAQADAVSTYADGADLRHCGGTARRRTRRR